ncbi:hypothetical protein PYW07_004820 [Mythimna separata]|uniref:Uncharacterized protein n=1 Tax=Mythimna separata TaxID=271217 RepID=A0AAD7YYD7_MYTSE|nr:hypothetical protein PYW07_004820 [Mythimna separata]
MMKKLVFCMLLLACAAAFEMYDENRAFPMDPNADTNYSEAAYDYEDLGPYRPEIRDDPYQSLMLYRLFNSLQNRDDARLHLRYRPKFSMIENPLASYSHVPYSELMDLKGAVVKRHANASVQRPKAKLEEAKEIKDDVKKVRKGFFFVCYLKLCSIRFPLTPSPI